MWDSTNISFDLAGYIYIHRLWNLSILDFILISFKQLVAHVNLWMNKILVIITETCADDEFRDLNEGRMMWCELMDMLKRMESNNN